MHATCIAVIGLLFPKATDCCRSTMTAALFDRHLPASRLNQNLAPRQREMGNGADTSSGTTLLQLPNDVQQHIWSLLAPNEHALSGRRVCKAVYCTLVNPQHCTVSLSRPLPPNAVPWSVEAGQQHVRQLPFRHKLELLCTAAASGSEANLEVALALLQPSVFPELLQSIPITNAPPWNLPAQADPGVAAVEGGHPQLLGWLLRHCPGLVGGAEVLATAARHSSLGVLQAVWEVMSSQPSGSSDGADRRPALQSQRILDAAAESATPDAVAKMEWLMSAADGRTWQLQGSTAAAAARSGALGRLRWLRDRGCPMGTQGDLMAALQHAGLAVAQWLVDEAGCELPAMWSEEDRRWDELLVAAAKSSGGAVAKWCWLQGRGAPELRLVAGQRRADLVVAMVEGGRVELVQHLLLTHGSNVLHGSVRHDVLGQAAARSGSVPMARLLHENTCVDATFLPSAYVAAAESGSVAMVRWLACDAGVSAVSLSTVDLAQFVAAWPRGKEAGGGSGGLLQAVQVLVDEAGYEDWLPAFFRCRGDGGGGVDNSSTSDVLACAAERGDLALAQYLLRRLRPYWPGGKTFAAAARGGCEALLEWLAAIPGRRFGAVVERCPYLEAAMSGDLGTLTALRRLGVPWGAEDVVAQAVEAGVEVQALRWLVEQGAPVGTVAGMEAAMEGREDDFEKGLGAEEVEWLQGLAAEAEHIGGAVQWSR